MADRREKVLNSPFNDKDILYFSKGAARLSDGFTHDRGGLPQNYFNDPVLRSGYLLYFLPVNLLKIHHILGQLSETEILSGKVRILDVGSGPGTSMLGIMSFYADLIRRNIIKDAWLEFTLVDQNYAVLQDAQNLHRLYSQALSRELPGFQSVCTIKHFGVQKEGLKRILKNFKYHFVILSNMLNEFPHEEGAEFCEHLIRMHLEPEMGRMIIIEPALRTASRDLQALRDDLVLERKVAHVWAPCLHEKQCPLNIVNKRDWCHFYFRWERPKFIAKVDKAIGNQKDWLACSYMILARKPRAWKEVGLSNTWRVISNQMPTKGKQEIVLCGYKGRYHAHRLDRHVSKINEDYGHLLRGDLVELSIPIAKEYDPDGKMEITQTTRIKKR